MDNDVNDIKEMCENLLGKDGIKECGVITVSGHPVTLCLSKSRNEDIFSVMCATIYSAATTLAEANGISLSLKVSIKDENGETIIKELSNRTLLAVVKENGGQQ